MTTTKRKIELHLLPVLRRQCRGSARRAAAITAKGLCFSLLIAGAFPHLAAAADNAAQAFIPSYPMFARESAAASSIVGARPVVAHPPKRANFERERASHAARYIANWVVDSDDNHSMPFAIVDKTDAKVFVFDADGRLRGAAPALLGLARGDDAVPGIGEREMASIRPGERTTPAGRFVASLDRNSQGKEILWVDYEDAISIHPVITTRPKERRAQRLSSPTPLDNRISFGCINVPLKFFENVVRPAFTGTNGIVYVLPETRSAREVFSSYDVDEHAQLHEHAQLQRANQPAPAAVSSARARF